MWIAKKSVIEKLVYMSILPVQQLSLFKSNINISTGLDFNVKLLFLWFWDITVFIPTCIANWNTNQGMSHCTESKSCTSERDFSSVPPLISWNAHFCLAAHHLGCDFHIWQNKHAELVGCLLMLFSLFCMELKWFQV